MKNFIFFLCIFLYVFPSYADEDTKPIKRYTLPRVETTTIEDTEYKCLDTTQWKRVLIITSGFHQLYDWRLEVQGALAAHESLIQSYELSLQTKDEQIALLSDYRDHLTLRLKQEVGMRSGVSKKAKIEKGLMWGVIAVETVLIGVLAIKGAVD